MALGFNFYNSILEIELSSDDHGGSFGVSESNALIEALRKHKSAKGILLFSSNRKVFCSGGDLRFFQKLKSKAQGLNAHRKIRKALASLASHPAFKVACVHKDCLGGGIELISCFDFVLASPAAQFGFWQRRMGLIFGWGGYQRLLLRIPEAKLKSHALQTQLISSYAAAELGIVDQIIPTQKLISEARKRLESQIHFSEESGAAIQALNPKNSTRFFEKLWGSKKHLEQLKKF